MYLLIDSSHENHQNSVNYSHGKSFHNFIQSKGKMFTLFNNSILKEIEGDNTGVIVRKNEVLTLIFKHSNRNQIGLLLNSLLFNPSLTILG
jgi:hypothetical protein